MYPAMEAHDLCSQTGNIPKKLVLFFQSVIIELCFNLQQSSIITNKFFLPYSQCYLRSLLQHTTYPSILIEDNPTSKRWNTAYSECTVSDTDKDMVTASISLVPRPSPATLSLHVLIKSRATGEGLDTRPGQYNVQCSAFHINTAKEIENHRSRRVRKN